MNSHLKTTLKEVNNFIATHNNPPEDLLENFVMELIVSNLFIPAVKGHNEITFEHMESEVGHQILPLFTDENEYGGTNELIANPISFYAEIILQCEFDGAVINPENESFFLSKDMMEGFLEDEEPDDGALPEPDELKRISQDIKNEKLLKFIRDESNFNRYDELVLILEDSVLLNVVASPEDLSQHAHDGILAALEVGGFNLSVKTSGREKYGLLFTSLDKILETYDRNSDVHHYYQIASMKNLIFYVLMNDMDGIIINPGLEEYYIPRNVLLDIYVNHKEITHNPKFYHAMHYAFLLDE